MVLTLNTCNQRKTCNECIRDNSLCMWCSSVSTIHFFHKLVPKSNIQYCTQYIVHKYIFMYLCNYRILWTKFKYEYRTSYWFLI